jgi:Fe-S cluster assembly protein SufD
MSKSTAKAAETFMAPAQPREDALPWLARGGANAMPDDAPNWVRALRQTAADSFAVTGLPQPGQEGWQFTSLRGLEAAAYAHPAVTVAAAAEIPAPLLADSYRLVLVDGVFQPQLSALPEGLKIARILDAASVVPHAEEYLLGLGDLAANPFRALNAAHVRDGFVVALDRGQTLDRPLEVLFWTRAGVAAYPRVLYALGENAEATVLERFAGEGAYFINSQTDVVLQQNARLTFHRLGEEAEKAAHISYTSVHAQKAAHFDGYAGAFSGALMRQEWQFKLLEKHVYSSLTGIYLTDGQQIQDFTVLAGHYDESGVSAQHFKGVVDDQARAVFQGKIYVHRAAQKTDGYQSHHALLLSEQAEANAKPELEIYADDVKCSHGATAGQLDPAALFYLRSRGIGEHEAKSLLIKSFMSEGIDKIARADIRELYEARIEAWLAARSMRTAA